MKISKTLVIGMYLHGEIHLNENGYVIEDKIPDGLHVTTINSVAPGVPNLSTLEDYEKMASKISNIIKSVKNCDELTSCNELTNIEIDKLSISIRNLLVKTNKKQSNNIIKEHHYLIKKNNVNLSLQKFAHQYDNAFKIKKYKSNTHIPNKLFIKFSDNEVLIPNHNSDNYFNKIILYNFEEESDLFSILKSFDLDIEEITMIQLMEFFVNLGVQNLIIIDLSCSTFKGDSKFLSERTIRQLRRQMI